MDRLCEKLDAAASDGEDEEMESLFSRLTLDVIGKAVFKHDFDSLTNGTDQAVYNVLKRGRKIEVLLQFHSGRSQYVETFHNVKGRSLQRMVNEEELQFHEEYMNEQDPSVLHFLLASGDDVSRKQLRAREDSMTLLMKHRRQF
ncbi:hypothetical protein L6164_010654 [Bauhinia variegata]|uniref:Uncharacterized protein n=1 Tax=Bauhinia variegata TaxID=167791 RepID=A0ACB9PNM0_BAUVA|nr:hypothetical protein L6164_010654 [Bauhinia variegata]